MIKILNKNKELQAMIKDSYNPWRFEEINGENKLSFNAILTEKVSNYVNENNMVGLENDYFDIAYYSKDMNEDGTCTMAIECEHISYRLNDPLYNKDYFTEIGTPNYILSKILQGTGFTIGRIDFTRVLTYSAQEKKSRRQLLMEFVALLGGEIDFNKFEISILNRIGDTDLQIFTKGKNIKVISKIYNGREEEPIIAYTCTPIILPNKDIGLGDDILLIQPELGIQDTLRVVRYGYNPYEKMKMEVEVANYINGLEDQLYRIETSTVAKEKVYNGCRIGPDEGFVAERSDLKAKTIMNATEGISIYSDMGSGLERNFFVDLAGRIQAKGLDIKGDATFQGAISASTISIGNGNFEVDINGNMIANKGKFKGDISASTININNNFIVDIDGNMIAKKGKFEGTIETTKDTIIGNNLYLGSTGDGGSKSIDFSTGHQSAHLTLYNNGDMNLFNWGNLEIDSSHGELKLIGNSVNINATENMNISASNIRIYPDTMSGAVILDEDSYIGFVDAYDGNLIATLDAIDNYIEDHVRRYH